MKRRWFAVIGACVAFGQVVVLIAFGFPAIRGWTAVGSVLPSLAGVLWIVGGFGVHLRNVEWYQFVGAANVVMGFWFGLEFSLPPYTASAAGPVLAITGIVGGLSMMFIGVSWIRNSRNFGISQYEPGPIFGLLSRNRT